MENTKRGFMAAFLAIVLVMLLAPFLLTAFAGAEGSGSGADSGSGSGADEQLVAWPSLVRENGSFNVAFLSEAGEWFESHFALRSNLLQLDQSLRGVFGATTSEKVIAGDNGWLYYSGTLGDFEGTAPMTDRQLQSIAYNLSLAQGYIQAQGATFTVTFAPNKNTIYPENMPSRFVETYAEHNIERLSTYLTNAGVNYRDLLGSLKEARTNSDTSLYYAKDSHWNEIGASVGFDALMSGIGLAHRTFGTSDFTWVDSDAGDLNVMINPAGGVTESVPVLARVRGFAFLRDVDDVEEPILETVSVTDEAKTNGTLLMYRDSFGNNLIPYMAEAFSRAYFTKYTPYDLTLVTSKNARHVIIERAERNLYSFASNPPIMPAPSTTVVPTVTLESSTTVSGAADGSLWKIQGWFQGVDMDVDSPVYVAIQSLGSADGAGSAGSSDGAGSAGSSDGADGVDGSGLSYVAFRTEALAGSTDTASDASAGESVDLGTSGFMLHVPQEDFPSGSYRVSVVVSMNSKLVRVAQTTVVL